MADRWTGLRDQFDGFTANLAKAAIKIGEPSSAMGVRQREGVNEHRRFGEKGALTPMDTIQLVSFDRSRAFFDSTRFDDHMAYATPR